MNRSIPRRLARMIASGGGCGFVPFAPGTVGSLVALALGALMLLGPSWLLLLAIVVATLVGLWIIGPAGGMDDPGWVVIDEFSGQWLAMLALNRPSPMGLLAAFALFRLFDITKPGPIGWADRQHGPLGIMGDDVIAGALAGVLVWALQMTWPEWF